MQSLNHIAILIATKNRENYLLSRSIPSVLNQTLPPALVIICNDGLPLKKTTMKSLFNLLNDENLIILDNQNGSGVAAAWNTGIEYLIQKKFNGVIAILDDDDFWDSDHLETNWNAMRKNDCDLVVSGLRLVRDGHLVKRSLIKSLNYREFFLGNPGWQGSNTFLKLSLLERVKGFRNGLVSCNDRDLAIRILRLSELRYSCTGRWTASWSYRSTGTLSSPASIQKLQGLSQFWILYGNEFTSTETKAFFTRAEKRFQFTKQQITDCANNIPEFTTGSNGSLQ
jgi:glycosyltransferase involved in cell wall biosynthesis